VRATQARLQEAPVCDELQPAGSEEKNAKRQISNAKEIRVGNSNYESWCSSLFGVWTFGVLDFAGEGTPPTTETGRKAKRRGGSAGAEIQ
jgi:hypothetical protein